MEPVDPVDVKTVDPEDGDPVDPVYVDPVDVNADAVMVARR